MFTLGVVFVKTIRNHFNSESRIYILICLRSQNTGTVTFFYSYSLWSKVNVDCWTCAHLTVLGTLILMSGMAHKIWTSGGKWFHILHFIFTFTWLLLLGSWCYNTAVLISGCPLPFFFFFLNKSVREEEKIPYREKEAYEVMSLGVCTQTGSLYLCIYVPIFIPNKVLLDSENLRRQK